MGYAQAENGIMPTHQNSTIDQCIEAIGAEMLIRAEVERCWQTLCAYGNMHG